MARQQRIDPGKIVPTAKPVQTFFKATPDNVAPAANVPKFGNVKGINIIQRGSVANVQGYNSFSQLSEAIGKLMPAFDAGAKLLASNEYERGSNEMLRAAENLNTESLYKLIQHSTLSKEIEKQDPIAGIQMDEMNMYRRAGALNQASEITKSFVKPMFDYAWAQSGGKLAFLDPGHPDILKTKARVTNAITSIFGLDEFSPGFQKKVAPLITRESEAFSEKHFQANLKLKKDSMTVQTALGFENILLNTNIGPNYENLPVLRETIRGYWDQRRVESGLGGESAAMIKKSILQTAKRMQLLIKTGNPQQQAQALRALEIMSLLPAGLGQRSKDPTEDAIGSLDNDITIGDAYGPEIYVNRASVDEAFYKVRDRAQKNAKALFDGAYGKKLFDAYLKNDVKLIQEIESEIYADNQTADFDRIGKQEFIKNIREGADNQRESNIELLNKENVNNFMNKWASTFGSDWNPKEANEEFMKIYEKIEYSQYKMDVLQQKENLFQSQLTDANNAVNNTDLKKLINDEMKVITEQYYPELFARLMIEGGETDVLKYMQNKDLDEAVAIRNFYPKLKAKIMTAIDEELISIGKGGSLKFDKLSDIVTKATQEIVGNESLINQLLPGRAKGFEPTETEEAELIDGKYDYGMTAKKEDLLKLDQQPVYSMKAIKRIYEDYDNKSNIFLGNFNDFGFKKSASRLNITPEKLLLIHLEHYKNYPAAQEWMPDEEALKRLEISGNQAQGMIDALYASSPGASPLAKNSRLFENILFGV